ncbi:MAG: DUF448 domain-containing protein [Deltaproteobacteria bacterium]|nr:DUF448 domain-containing protein [Deltaproteobacteria bacterium]
MQPTSEAVQSRTPGREKRHAGTRSCVGCGARVAREQVRSELLRLVAVPREDRKLVDVVVDLAGSSVGRGVWVHGRRPCLQEAVRKGLARSVRGLGRKVQVATDLPTLSQQIVDAAGRRAESLLRAALRGGRAAVGGAAVDEAASAGPIALVLVAQDARAALGRTAVRRAFDAGAATVWGTKDSLGQLVGRSEVAVIAVLDGGIAAALGHTIGLSETFSSAEQGEVDRCNE